jgi:hypothetical protein
MSYSNAIVMTHDRVKELRLHIKGYHQVWDSIASGRFGYDVSLHTQEWWRSVKNRDHIAISFVTFRINKYYRNYDINDYVPTEWLDDIKQRMFEVNQVLLSYVNF